MWIDSIEKKSEKERTRTGEKNITTKKNKQKQTWCV